MPRQGYVIDGSGNTTAMALRRSLARRLTTFFLGLGALGNGASLFAPEPWSTVALVLVVAFALLSVVLVYVVPRSS